VSLVIGMFVVGGSSAASKGRHCNHFWERLTGVHLVMPGGRGEELS